MPFIENSEVIARKAMSGINAALTDKFVAVIQFLKENPDCAGKHRKKSVSVGTEDYISYAALSFAKGREPKNPEKPSTIPDEMVSVVLEHYFNCPHDIAHLF